MNPQDLPTKPSSTRAVVRSTFQALAVRPHEFTNSELLLTNDLFRNNEKMTYETFSFYYLATALAFAAVGLALWVLGPLADRLHKKLEASLLRMKQEEPISTPIETSSNVSPDLGDADSAAMQRKASMVAKLSKSIEDGQLTPADAAVAPGVGQDEIFQILQGKFGDVGEDKLKLATGTSMYEEDDGPLADVQIAALRRR